MDKQLIVNGLLVSFYETGAGEGKTLLFLHGWRSQAAIWQPAIASLRLSGYKVYALDLPGFGGSPAPAGDWYVADYANVVEEFIRKLGLGKVILVGHSFGGRIGIKLAANRPELMSKLVLVDSAAFPASQSKKKVFSILARIAKPFFRPSFMQGVRRKIYKQIGAEDYVATPALQKTFINIVNEDLTEDLKNINIPTLIVYGDKDVDTPPAYGQKMQSLIPNSTFCTLPNAGHYSFLDEPDEFRQKLQSFIAS